MSNFKKIFVSGFSDDHVQDTQLQGKVTKHRWAEAAAGMRVVARQLEEGRRRERQASYMAHISCRGLSCVGDLTLATQL